MIVKMIYTVTFNPSLDYIVSVKDFQLGLTNRTDSELLLPGGKGLNVSMVLGNLGVANTALGFVAGFTGEEIIRRIRQMGVKSDLIRMDEGVSRINLKLKSIDGTEINGCGPCISQEYIRKLMDKLDRLQEGDMLVLAGSIPNSMPDDIYGEIMANLVGRGVLVIVDASKDLLVQVLEHRPFLVKPNHHELGEIFQVELKTREEVIPYAKKMQSMGAVNVLVSMAGEGAVLAAADGKVYTAPAPEGRLVNAVGAGDSMVAGFLAGWIEKKDYKYAFAMGVAAGSASAFSEQLATGEEIKEVYPKVKAEQTAFDIRKVQIAGMSCDLFLPEGYDGGHDSYPVIYINGEIPIQEVLSEAMIYGIRPDFILLAVRPSSWNDDFTPWSSPAFAKGEAEPQGKADDYIAKLSEGIKPYMDTNYRTKPEPEHTALFGYSLGGLAAVYSLYRTDQFGVVGSLSGSLWYDGFCGYMDSAKLLRTNVSVYLSLGKKEKLGRNPRMRQVAECTQKAREILARQMGTDLVYFEWNEGGHFHEIEKRFAKALLWCLTDTDF